MAEEDVILQKYAFFCIKYGGIILVMKYLFTNKAIHDRVYAYILDRLIKPVNKLMGPRKESLILANLTEMARSKGRPLRVLDLGAGGGANFKYMPEGTEVIAVDPNPKFDTYLEKNAAAFPHVRVSQFVVACGEDMSEVRTSSVDAVVCTLVLCSAKDHTQCMQEVKRVLMPGGHFYFIEHVRAEEGTWRLTFQKLLHPLWIRVAECNLLSQPWIAIDKAGFSSVNYKVEVDQHPKLRGFHHLIKRNCIGMAIK